MSRFVGGKSPEGYSGNGPVKPPSGGGGGTRPVKPTGGRGSGTGGTGTRGSQPGKPAPGRKTK